MGELKRVSEAHGCHIRVLVEETDHLEIMLQFGGLLLFQELPHAEALLGIPQGPSEARLHSQAIGVQVHNVQLHWLGGASHDDSIYATALSRHLWRAHIHYRLSHHKTHAVDLRGMQHILSNADIGRQIRSINLEFTAYSSFDSPTIMQTKCQIDAATSAQPLLQARVPTIGGQHCRPMHTTKDPGKGQHGHVRDFCLVVFVQSASMVVLLLKIHGSPNQEEHVAIVLVGSSVE
mmetsp:Transcript_88947/g.167624  ORF Transcript_88947/g.167624 Transcript_88947/m.167624 type:complete len:234 (-) Transcript_88947:1670-2371(-)